MRMMINFSKLLYNIFLILILKNIRAQEPNVVLNQGAMVGVKIFPESSKVPIDAFLGIPYAAPPVGRLRFSAPEKHKGWKRTLFAQEFGPPCMQLGAGQRVGSKQRNEDCLYLNIWAPENAQRFGNLPVLLILHSESFNDDAPLQLPGQDLAAEGLVVVSANYRLNVFGFLCLDSAEARGNLGLLDQYFAMLWIKENIAKFGGDPAAVTLLGHSAGATSVLYHMVSPRTKSLFGKAIMMSGSVTPIWSEKNVTVASRSIALALGCYSFVPKETVQCLRERTTDDLLKAIKTHQGGNFTESMVPTVDKFLPKNDQYLPIAAKEALSSGNFHQIPIITGLTSVESSDSKGAEHWEALARQGYRQLRHYAEHTAVPRLMASRGLGGGPGSGYVAELLKWEYLDAGGEGGAREDGRELLARLQLLHSEAQYESAHARLVAHLARSTRPVYVYKYHQLGGVDLYGRKSNASGAAHGSDLPYLLGPTLFQQLTRRRLSQQEERLSKRMRIMWSEFVKFGYPMPERQYDAWRPYTEGDAYVQQIGDGGGAPIPAQRRRSSGAYWNVFLPRLANLTADRDGRSLQSEVKRAGYDGNETIRHAMYTLLGLVLALLALLVVCVVLLKRAAKERRRSRDLSAF